jgi:ligand-binding sensor domain-containing protein
MEIISWKNLTRLFVGFVPASLVFLLVTTVYIQRQTRLQLSAFTKDNGTQISFERENLSSHPANSISLLQNTQQIRALEQFRGFVFAAGGGGLLKLDENGNRLKHFTVLDGLPESDLISLAAFQDKLFIGTRTKGLISYDGRKFSRFILTDRDPQTITTLLSEPHRLLIGTFNGGLIAFDGRSFTEIFAGEKNERIYRINHLSKIGERLFVGTFDNGMWLLVGEVERKHFTRADGLLSDRIVGVVAGAGKTYVGTDLGISEIDSAELGDRRSDGKKKFRTHKILPSLSSLISFDEKLLAAKANGGLFLFEPEADSKEPNIVWENSGKLRETLLLKIKDETFLASERGIFRIAGENKFSVSLEKFGEDSEDFQPTHNTISAIAFDTDENLWLGSFRNGIDVFGSNGEKLKHIETEEIRDINSLLGTENGIMAATSQGVFLIDRNFRVSEYVTAEILPGKSVMHISSAGHGSDALATSRGFLLIENGRTRGFSTVQGLPSNNIYATLHTNRTTLVGTLGGLARIEDGRVVRVYNDAASELSPNWVTALCETNGRIFIGTYGGGVFELLESGDLRKFSNETGKFFVNPNALFGDGERLYAGTLEGLRVFDLKTGKWTHIRHILPAETVLSVTGKDEKLYVGTTAGVAIINKSFFAGR